MRAFADQQILGVNLNALRTQFRDFFPKSNGINDNPIPDDTEFAFAQNAGGNQAQDVFLFANNNRVARVVPP